MPKQDNMHVQTIRVDGGTYEQKYAVCSKKNCWCHTTEGQILRGKPAHGPYWYRVIKKHDKVIRRYIGKELVTSASQRAAERASRKRTTQAGLLEGIAFDK